MGIERVDYLMLAYQPPEDVINSIDFDDFENEYCQGPGRRFDIVSDPMEGEFFFIGKVLSTVDEDDGWGVTVIDRPSLYIEEGMIKRINATLNLKLKQDDFKLILVTRWS